MIQTYFSKKVTEIIKRNIEYRHLNSEFIAQELGISRMSLHRRLKKTDGMNTTEFINSVRIEKAKKYLLETQLPIKETALKTGFKNITYFSKKFKKETGENPSEYRKIFSIYSN